MDNFELTAIDGLLSLRDHSKLTPPYIFQLDSPIPFPVPITPGYSDMKTSSFSEWSDSSSQRSYVDTVYYEHLIPRTVHPLNSVSLPPINELLSQYPSSHTKKISNHSPRNSAFSQFSRVVPYHPYPRKQLISSPVPTTTTTTMTTTIDRRVVELQTPSASIVKPLRTDPDYYLYRQPNEPQSKKQYNPASIYQCSQQLQAKILLLAKEHHRLLTTIQPQVKFNFSVFFQELRQVYGDEIEKQLLKPKMNEVNYVGDDDDSCAESSNKNNNHNSSVQSNFRKGTKKYITKPTNGTDKPRWTLLEKAELFEAIIKHKKLDIMSSFDWAEIGTFCEKQDKACKDQWRRGVLKMLRDSFEEDF